MGFSYQQFAWHLVMTSRGAVDLTVKTTVVRYIGSDIFLTENWENWEAFYAAAQLRSMKPRSWKHVEHCMNLADNHGMNMSSSVQSLILSFTQLTGRLRLRRLP
jgi:hypothetical protein